MPKVNVDIPAALKCRLDDESRERMLSQRALVILALEEHFASRALLFAKPGSGEPSNPGRLSPFNPAPAPLVMQAASEGAGK